MTKFKFRKGDKVRILDGSNIENYTGSWTTGPHGLEYLVGEVGTVMASEIRSQGRKGYRLKGYPFVFDERGLKLVGDVITIERHGQKMVAKYNGKVGVAKCSDDDEFDMFTGANLALQRLFGEEEKKEEPKWSLGDIVRAKRNPHVAESTIGRVVTTDPSDTSLPVEVKFENCTRSFWMRTEQLEKIDF